MRIELPHAAHFCLANKCMFKRATYTNGYIISTIGEYIESDKSNKFTEIGSGRLYETMVFKAMPSESTLCCKYIPSSYTELEMKAYNHPELANDGHEELVKKYEEM